jgi:hypothetical protein
MIANSKFLKKIVHYLHLLHEVVPMFLLPFSVYLIIISTTPASPISRELTNSATITSISIASFSRPAADTTLSISSWRRLTVPLPLPSRRLLPQWWIKRQIKQRVTYSPRLTLLLHYKRSSSINNLRITRYLPPMLPHEVQMHLGLAVNDGPGLYLSGGTPCQF